MTSSNPVTTIITERRGLLGERPRKPVLALAVLWSRAEPERVGEVAIPEVEPDQIVWFGRSPRHGAQALHLSRHRPGSIVDTGAPRSAGISREQWRIRVGADALEIENIGQRPLLHNGARTLLAKARPGDRVEIGDEMLFLVVRRLPAR